MKRIVPTLSILGLMLAAPCTVMAVDNLAISVVVTIRTVTVVWTSGGDTATRDWTLNCLLNTVYDTNTNGKSGGSAMSGQLTRFDVTNSTGSEVDIATTVTEGANWTIGAAAGSNVYRLRNSVDGGAYSAAMVTGATSIKSALANAGSMGFDLQFNTPTAVPAGASNTITVTLTATLTP